MWRSFAVGDSTVSVRTTSAAFGRWMDRALGPYRTSEAASPEHAYSVVIDGGQADGAGTGKRFHFLYQGVGVVARTLDLVTIARSLLSELQAHALHRRVDGVYVHHGLVRSDDIGVLVPAWLVSYLSATGRRPAKIGITLPVSRWVRLDDAGRAIPGTPVLDIPGDALARLPRTPGHAREAVTSEDTGDARTIHAIVTYRDDMDTLAGGGSAAALYHLASGCANLETLGGRAVNVLARVVERAHCFQTGLGRPQQMLDALRAVFEHERAHAVVGARL